MHGKSMKYILVAAGGLVVGLLAAGSSLRSVLPFLLLLACPLMMLLMMRGMGGHGSHGTDRDSGNQDGVSQNRATQDSAARDHDDTTTRW